MKYFLALSTFCLLTLNYNSSAKAETYGDSTGWNKQDRANALEHLKFNAFQQCDDVGADHPIDMKFREEQSEDLDSSIYYIQFACAGKKMNRLRQSYWAPTKTPQQIAQETCESEDQRAEVLATFKSDRSYLPNLVLFRCTQQLSDYQWLSQIHEVTSTSFSRRAKLERIIRGVSSTVNQLRYNNEMKIEKSCKRKGFSKSMLIFHEQPRENFLGQFVVTSNYRCYDLK